MRQSIISVEGAPAYRTLIPDSDKHSPMALYPFVGLNGSILKSEKHNPKIGRSEGIDLTVHPFIGVSTVFEGRADVSLGYGQILESETDEGIYSAFLKRLHYNDPSHSLIGHLGNFEGAPYVFDPITAFQSFRFLETTPLPELNDLAIYDRKLQALSNNTVKVNDRKIYAESAIETQYPSLASREANTISIDDIPPNLDELTAIMQERRIPFTLRSLRPYMEAGIYAPSEIVANKLRDEKPDKPDISKKLGMANSLIPIVAAGLVNSELIYEVVSGGLNIDYVSLASLLTTAGLSSLATFRAWQARQNHPYLEQFFEKTGPIVSETPTPLTEAEKWKEFNDESGLIAFGIFGTAVTLVGTVMGMTYHPEITIPILTYPWTRLSASAIFEQKYLKPEPNRKS